MLFGKTEMHQCSSVDSDRGLPFKPTEAMAVCYYQKHFQHPCGLPLIHHLMACSFTESHMMGVYTCVCYSQLINMLLRKTHLMQLITSTVFQREMTKNSFSADNTEKFLSLEDAKRMRRGKTRSRHLRGLHHGCRQSI